MATYVNRRKSAKGRSKQEGSPDKNQQEKSAGTGNPAQDNHDFVNEYRMKELSGQRGPFGVDIDSVR